MAEKGKEAATASHTEELPGHEEPMPQRSKEKGKAQVVEEEELNLMDIKPGDLDKPIEVKVYRKWTSKNVPDPNPTGLCFILLDRKGSAIQANVHLWDMRQFDSGLQIGSCYKIERFGCKRTENWQRTLNNPITLLFGRYTLVTPIENDGFADHYFNFIAYNEIGQRADTRDYALTDYIGIVRNIGYIKESGDPTTNRILRRNIDIQNLNGNVLTFTIWNEMATNFPLETLGQLDHPVVIAVSSCWARRFPGGLQLSATPATYYYLNPRLEETDHIRQVYDEMMLPTPPLQIPTAGIQQPEQAPARQLTPLNVLMQASPESIVQQFTTQATIVGIDEQMGWYFNRCRTCGSKITYNMPHRHCQQPGVRPIPNYSYCLRLTLADETGNVVVTCFSPEADPLPHSSVTDLVSYIPDPDPYVFPPIILALENTAHIFHVHLAKGSRRGFPRFILDGAEDVPLPALPEAPAQTEEGGSSAPVESPPQTPVVTEIGASSITPPPLSDEPAEKISATNEAEPSIVHRQLFEETGEQQSPDTTEKTDDGKEDPPVHAAKKVKRD